MKNSKKTLLTTSIFLIASFLYFNFLWNGNYYDMNKSDSLGLPTSLANVSNDSGAIKISIWNLSSWLFVSAIKYAVADDIITIWSYQKPYFPWIITNEIQSKEIFIWKWKYKAYYKNLDWSMIFIKDINLE